MSSPLLVNTHLNRLHGRWQPSINTSTIREEDGLNRHSTVYEQDDKSGNNDEDEEDDENVALGHLGQHRAGAHNNTDDNQSEDDEDELDEDEEDDEDDEDEDGLAADDDDSSTFTSSPSIPDENIDFDLVYTLHTFEATVEGQASVLKGDSLTLLDDSNSYWWLVKVLKSNEVGYIPAENIETPFERLARLNKHRNVEVTAIQQATHYINADSESSSGTKTAPGITKQRKNVSMSKDIYYQSHIILLGDDDEELEETYEEWEDDMVDEDSQSTMLASEDDQGTGEHGLDNSDTEMDHDDGNDDDEDNELLHSRAETTDDEVHGLRVKNPSATANDAAQHINEPSSTTISNQPKKTTLATSPTSVTGPTSTSAPVTTANTSVHSGQPISSSLSPKDSRDNKKNGGSFLRLFTRGKRYDGKKIGGTQTTPIDNTSTSDQGSTNSSTISEETGGQQKDNISSTAASAIPGSSSTSSMSALDPSATVLRVYAGNINVNATYNSVLVYDHTNAEILLRQALDRFHISQIEGKARGKRSSMTSSPSQYPHQQNSSGVEYYLSVKPIDGDELTLLPQDKPLMIYQSLTAHLTTPMPSLSNLKQQITNVEFGRIGSPTNNKKRTGTKFGEDSIRFYLHKRIKRVNEQDGQLYVKVSLYHDDAKQERKNSDTKDGKRRNSPNNSVGVSSSSLNNNHNKANNNSGNSGGSYSSLSPGSFSMRRKKSSSSSAPSATSPKTAKSNTSTTSSSSANTQSQIDKLIAVSPVATVADLIDIALEKFHLVQQPRLDTQTSPRYRMLIVVNSQGPEKHLNLNSKLVEVLHDDTHAKNTTEKRFVLRKVTTVSSRSGHNISNNGGKDTRTVQQNNTNKSPASNPQQRQHQKLQQKQGEELDAIRSNTTTSPLLTPIPVMQLDTDLEMVLRRLERALMTYNRKSTAIDSVPPRLQLDPQQPKLAVMRNVNQGVDVYLPHGILRSKPLPPQQTQYVLMANDKKKDSPWDLVTQRVLASSPPLTAGTSASALPQTATTPATATTTTTTTTTSSSSSSELVADADLKALIKFATQYLESKEKAGTGSSVNNDTMGTLANKDGSLQPSSSLSSLDELERELQRIMASHTIS
ncbi:hypothetical protein BCR42DRAFT_90949 [Absidia repens]|uniref:SH3 domain-containing protein n=1 Tax=Absidia repens TaxID=90262 RepID=A0A1X2IYT4_9FUNG|nr:hypothetical protein BCR42DRAFT_90949 [Absidia repens]